MLIGLCGGLCAGKETVANFLVQEHGFQKLHLVPGDESGSSAASKPKTASNSTNGTHETDQIAFPNVDNLLEFVTRRWRERWVLTNISSEAALEPLSRRPFFLLVSIDAPVSTRWSRRRRKVHRNDVAPSEETFEGFVKRSDHDLYNSHQGLARIMAMADIRLINASSTLDELHCGLRLLDLTDEGRMRPSWDQYFMQLASLAAHRSNCMKRRVGCVLVRQKRVISTGYNGTPRGLTNCNEGGCPRCNDAAHAGIGLSTCLCMHAEENALLEAGRERIREGSILYCDTCPCLTCSIKIAQVGITEVVYSQEYSMDGKAAAVFNEAGIKLRQFVPVGRQNNGNCFV